MASTHKGEIAKKEETSKLWTLPEYPGDNPKPSSHRKKHRKASESSSCKSEDSQADEPKMEPTSFPDPTARYLPHYTQPAKQVRSSDHRRAHDPRVIYSSRNPAPARDASPTGHQLPGRTYGVMTVSAKGAYKHPSQDALEMRMNIVYPGYKTNLLSGAEQTGDKARVSHIKEVWRLVTTVDEELTGMISANPHGHLELNRHTSFGVQLNYLIKMHGTAQRPLASGQSSNIQSQTLPSHEEMMAYKILNRHFSFPSWMVEILRGTANEYLLYPLLPVGPVIKNAQPVPQGPSSASMERIAYLEAKLKTAKKELSKHKAEIEAGKEQAEADAKKRRAEILRSAEKQAKENEAHRKEIKEMIAFMEESVTAAEELHSKRITSSRQFMDQVNEWRKKGKLDADDSSSDDQEDGGGDDESGSEEGSSEDDCSGEEDEEDERPTKIRRIG